MPMHTSPLATRASRDSLAHLGDLDWMAPLAVPMQRHSLGALPSADEALEVSVMVRHSAPVLSRAAPTVSAKDAPETILTRTGVRVAGVSKRDGHCVYAMEVDTGVATRVVHKRYSEFRDFRAQLLGVIHDKKTHCGQGPCALLAQLAQVKFPRRRLRLPGLRREANLEVAKQRVDLLERFMQAMLRVYRMASRRSIRSCLNAKCVVIGMIKDFLQVAEPVFIAQAAGTSEQAEIDAFAAHLENTEAMALRLPPMPLGFPMLAQASLRAGKHPAGLFPIAEDHEPVRASE